MAKIKSSGSEAELRLKQLSVGLRCRANVRGLPGTPDLANKRRRIAIFMHGCFWHGHACSRLPQTNTDYWRRKRETNQARDKRVIRRLWSMGYAVLVVWECEVAKRPDLVKKRLERLFERAA